MANSQRLADEVTRAAAEAAQIAASALRQVQELDRSKNGAFLRQVYDLDVNGTASAVQNAAKRYKQLANRGGDKAQLNSLYESVRHSLQALKDAAGPVQAPWHQDAVNKIVNAAWNHHGRSTHDDAHSILQSASTPTLLEAVLRLKDRYREQLANLQQKEAALLDTLDRQRASSKAELDQLGQAFLQKRAEMEAVQGQVDRLTGDMRGMEELRAKYAQLQQQTEVAAAEWSSTKQAMESDARSIIQQLEQCREARKMLAQVLRQQRGLHGRLKDAFANNSLEHVAGTCLAEIENLKRHFQGMDATLLELNKTSGSHGKQRVTTARSKFEELRNKFNEQVNSGNACLQQLTTWRARVGQSYQQLEAELSNLKEDLLGRVRVYVRQSSAGTKSGGRGTTAVADTNARTVKVGQEEYGPFSGVYSATQTNADMYKLGLSGTLAQVNSGYSIVMFGYGASGSGKTHTLFGNAGEQGICQLALDDFAKQGASVKLEYAFELYQGSVNMVMQKMTGKVYWLYAQSQASLPAWMRDARFTEDQTQAVQQLPTDLSVQGSLGELSSIITKVREKANPMRIKQTAFNAQSSRSHLFLVFKVQMPNQPAGFLTVVDMAGREEPGELLTSFGMNRSQLTSVLMGTVPSSLPQVDMLKESIYINESLNHLTYYLRKRSGQEARKPRMMTLDPTKDVQYNLQRFIVNPETEAGSFSPQQQGSRPRSSSSSSGGSDSAQRIMKPTPAKPASTQKPATADATANNCLMIPCLDFVSNLHEQDVALPTKFVMLCMVREQQEEGGKDWLRSTLEFAHKIRS